MLFSFDEFELDGEHLELRRAGKLVRADALVLRLLAYLVENAGKLISKEQLIEKVWDGRSVADNAITVSMARLRKLLGQARGEPEYVTTTYGRGYRFVRDVVVRGGEVRGAAAPAPSSERSDGPPFVGRERALLQLRRAFAEARAGRGRGCLLLGEPGIGKTRAVETFTRELAASGVRVAWGFCREAGDTPPLWPWIRLLSDVLAADGGTSLHVLDALPEDLRRFLGLTRGDNPPNEAQVTPASGLASPERHRHFDAILRRFVTASEKTPWVLVIDDLHRADAASLELLVQLLDELAHTRILVIATLRHTPGRSSPRSGTYLPHVLGHRNCERILLERLSEAEVHEYVRALLDDPDAAFARAVYAKSEGNPFFMTELARTLSDAKQADAHSLAVPAAALELVRQRVARIDPEVRDVLSAAAVIGRSFELPLLAAVVERDPSKLMIALDDAIEADIVVAAPGSMTAFAFGHALLGEVLTDALSPTEKRSWHLRIARVLEQRLSTGDSVPASELAYHFHAALPAGDPRKAIQYCRAAAAAAGQVFASPDVVRYARHALEALDLMDQPSARLRMSLVYMIAMFSRSYAPDECARMIPEVARLARESGDAVMMLRAATMFNSHPGFEPLPGQTALIEQALDMFQPEQRGFRSVALAVLALAAPYCKSAQRSSELIEEAMPLCRASRSPLALYAVLVCRLYRYGGPAHAAIAAETAEELERQVVHNPGQTPALPITLAFHRAVTAFQSGELTTLTAASERASLRAHALKSAYNIWHADRIMAITRLQFGDAADGCDELERLHERLEHGPVWGANLFCAFDRAVTLAEFGRGRPLDAAYHAALQYQASDPPGIWALKVRALAGSGQLDEARNALRVMSPSELRELPCDRDYLGTLGHLARVALLLRETEYAKTLYDMLGPHGEYFAVSASFWCEGAVAQLLGMLARDAGEPDAVIPHLRAGLRHSERAGLTLRALETRLLLADCLSSKSTRDAQTEAQSLAQEAHGAATRLGHTAWIGEADALLARIGG